MYVVMLSIEGLNEKKLFRDGEDKLKHRIDSFGIKHRENKYYLVHEYSWISAENIHDHGKYLVWSDGCQAIDIWPPGSFISYTIDSLSVTSFCI